MDPFEDLKTFALINVIGGIVWLVIFASLGYFVYGGTPGAIAVVVVSFVYGLTIIIALIPYVGFLVQIAAIHYYVWPWVSEFTHIQGTWLTDILWVITIIAGFIYTVSITYETRSR
jgi:hypothetical protein